MTDALDHAFDVREEAERLVPDIDFDGMSDAEIRRLVSVEMIQCRNDMTDSFYTGVFQVLAEDKSTVMRDARERRKQQLEALGQTDIAGLPN
jgi:hypothetical protein